MNGVACNEPFAGSTNALVDLLVKNVDCPSDDEDDR
jgi:hypothetical protein